MRKLMKNMAVFLFVSLLGLSILPMSKIDARPDSSHDWEITIASKDDIKGCYYTGNTTNQQWTNERCFKDDKLAQIVYHSLLDFYEENPDALRSIDTANKGDILGNAVVNGDTLTFEDTSGNPIKTNMRTVLAGYRGEIAAKWKSGPKITSIKGIQFLTHAQSVDLRMNAIEDFTELNVSVVNSADYDIKYYGYGIGEDPDDPLQSRNVTWDLGGNPFRFIPYQLGGRLVVKATQTVSSNYPDAEQPKLYFKRGDQPLAGVLDIARCKIMKTNDKGQPIDNDGNIITDASKVIYRWVYVNNIKFVNSKNSDDEEEVEIPLNGIKLDTTKGDVDGMGVHTGFTDEKMYFTDLLMSRKQRIGVGLDQELHYSTADEFDTPGPGSQSFKFYIDPYLYVYDTVKATSTNTQGVILTKKGTDNKLLAGATYTLYKDAKILKKDLITDNNGKLVIDGLENGTYMLIETKAPKGYVLDATPINFTVKNENGIAIGGGTNTFTTDNGDPSATKQTYQAQQNETFIAGPLNDNITLTLNNGSQQPTKVNVTYKKLYNDTNPAIEDRKVEYATLAEAENGINQLKHDSKILGDVFVEAVFEGKGVNALTFDQKNEKNPEPETPIEPVEPDTPQTPEESMKPNTSDSTSLQFWAIVVVLSAAVLGALIIRKQRKI